MSDRNRSSQANKQQATAKPVTRTATTVPKGNPSPLKTQPRAATKTVSAPKDKNALEDLALKILLFQRKETKVDPQTLTKMAQEIQQEAAEVLPVEPGVLLGILALCGIPGHDVHVLNTELRIDQHIPIGSRLDDRLEIARHLLLQRDDFLCAIFVFENINMYLNKNGELSENDPLA